MALTGICLSNWPCAGGDGLKPCDMLVGKELAPNVALSHKAEVAENGGLGLLHLAPECLLVFLAFNEFAIVVDFGIAQQNLKTRAHLVYAVIDGLKFGGLVHHIFGSRDLAAVMLAGPHTLGLTVYIRRCSTTEES